MLSKARTSNNGECACAARSDHDRLKIKYSVSLALQCRGLRQFFVVSSVRISYSTADRIFLTGQRLRDY